MTLPPPTGLGDDIVTDRQLSLSWDAVDPTEPPTVIRTLSEATD